MKRPAFALCAGILLLGLLPGSTLAKAPRNILDLSNPMVSGYTLGSGDTLNLAQTLKADKSGMLTEVDIWMGGAGIVDVQIENLSAGLPDGINQASTSACSCTFSAARWLVASQTRWSSGSGVRAVR